MCLQHQFLVHGQCRHHRWSKQGSLLTCKAGPEEDDEDDDDTDIDGDVNHDGDDDDVDDEVIQQAPTAIDSRDVSRMVSGMMTNLDVSSKVKMDTTILHTSIVLVCGANPRGTFTGNFPNVCNSSSGSDDGVDSG